MTVTVVLFLHLIATCGALGTIVLTDMRLMAKLVGYRVVIPPPQRLETVTITASLLMLYLTGGVLVWLGTAQDPAYLVNPKLQAKLILVGVLSLNALVLHYRAFPLLGRKEPISHWTRWQWLTLAASVSVSNSLWFFSAFLGVARVWTFTVSLWFVLGIAAMVWLVMFCIVNLVLWMASRDAPKASPDWVDLTISTVSDLAQLTAADSESPRGRGANQSQYGSLPASRRGSRAPARSRGAD